MQGIITDPENGDLLIKDGQIAVGTIDDQCIEQILMSNRGEYKEYPLIGGEIVKMLHGVENRFWANRIRNMCSAMGLRIKRVSVIGSRQIIVEK